MSYILDALKKSEREKTLGQVPTLESVVADGAKKQRSGTPWWLNLIVFFIALFAVVAILKMAGLIDFSGAQNQQAESAGQADTTASQTGTGSTQIQTAVAESQAVQTEAAETSQTAPEPVATETASVPAAEPQPQALAEALPADSETPVASGDVAETIPDTDSQQAAMADDGRDLLAEKHIAQEAEELAALAQQQQLELELQQQQLRQQQLQQQQLQQQQLQQANTGAVGGGSQSSAAGQSSQPGYEEVIHDGLRNISVNVVSYSSDARQRFVMLDLTIYKEGDQLPNNATVVEIIRTGAVVEYQNKRYLLKP